jgi:hypothetical protein
LWAQTQDLKPNTPTWTSFWIAETLGPRPLL